MKISMRSNQNYKAKIVNNRCRCVTLSSEILQRLVIEISGLTYLDHPVLTGRRNPRNEFTFDFIALSEPPIKCMDKNR